MRNPINLFVFAVCGGLVGTMFGLIVANLVSGDGIDYAESDVIATLTAQETAWNAGDIEGFMDGYIRSEDLRFASGGTVESGWQTTLDRYLRRYPDRATMGQLSFTDLDVTPIDGDDALVFGRWTLNRAGDAPTGLFTLHMHKSDGTWRVVSDHTSSQSSSE